MVATCCTPEWAINQYTVDQNISWFPTGNIQMLINLDNTFIQCPTRTKILWMLLQQHKNPQNCAFYD